MTENERAINTLDAMKKQFFGETRDVLDMAIKALKEIRQYREYKEIFESHFSEEALKLLSNKEEFGKWLERGKWIAKRCDEINRELEQYRAIGTVEELKAIKQWKTDVIECFCKYDASSFEEIVVNARKKAIDEFAEEIAFGIYESVIWDMLATMSKNGSLSDTSDKIVDYVIETSKKIAEQLKAGGIIG